MIEIKNLSKKFGDTTVLDDISLSANGVLGICGGAGSGKSTLLGIIAGTIPATAGEVLIDGKALPSDPFKLSKSVGYLAAGAPAFSEFTVYEFLCFVGQAKKITEEKLLRQIDEVIELTELSKIKDVYIEHLSLSQRKIVGIAQALLGNPKVVVLDDPFAGIDSEALTTMKAIVKMLGDIKTVVISSRKQSDIASVCSDVFVLPSKQIEVEESIDIASIEESIDVADKEDEE